MKMPEAINMAKLFTQATAENRAPCSDSLTSLESLARMTGVVTNDRKSNPYPVNMRGVMVANAKTTIPRMLKARPISATQVSARQNCRSLRPSRLVR